MGPKRIISVSVKKEPDVIELLDDDTEDEEAAPGQPKLITTTKPSSSSPTSLFIKSEDRKTIERDQKPFLPEESIARRLSHIRTAPTQLNLHHSAIQQTFLRKFISNRYGGNLQAAYPKPDDSHLKKHNIAVFAFLKPDWNPYLPENPGEHGLAFTKDRPPTTAALPLFVWLPPNKWKYYGEYRVHDSEPLSATEWSNQPPVVQETWIANFFGNNWAANMNGKEVRRRCARYIVRKDHRRADNRHEPTEEEVRQFLESGRHADLTHGILRQDLDRGLANLPVRVLECVGYDRDFLFELLNGYCDKEENWKTFPRELERRYADIRASQELASGGESEGLESDEQTVPRKRRRRSRSGS